MQEGKREWKKAREIESKREELCRNGGGEREREEGRKRRNWKLETAESSKR